MYRFKLSGFADEAGKAADEQIRVLKLNGVQNVEVRNVDGKNVIDMSGAELRAFKAKLDAGGIAVSAIGSPVGKTPIGDDFAAAKAALEKALDAAEILGAPYIRAFSFFIPKESDPMQYADEVVKRLTVMTEAAAARKVQYALENESGIFTNIPERCLYVLERVPALRLAFDPGNFIMNNAAPADAWPLLKDKVCYFHIKDATKDPRRFAPAGEGVGSITAILKDAFAGGFDNFLSIEPHLGYMEQLNDAQRFTYAVNALKKILNAEFNAGLELVDLNAAKA